MVRAFIAIGSNISPAQNVRAALRSLAAETRLSALSMVYLTPALGRPEQPDYYNCVAELATARLPADIKRAVLLPIEAALGRRRTADKYAPRTIELDLIVYGDLVMNAEGITLPDPDILERPFLAVPLSELAPEMVLAGFNRRVADIAAALGRDGMRPLTRYASALRAELFQQQPVP